MIKRLFLLLPLLVFTLSMQAQKSNAMQQRYNFQRAVELLQQDQPDVDGAIDLLKKEVDNMPKNGYAWGLLGNLYDSKDQEGEALTCLTTAIPLLKKDKNMQAYAYRVRASVYVQLGHDELAKQDWQSALKADPSDTEVLRDRSRYYVNKEQYDLAEADYDQFIKLEPGNTYGYKGKGLIRAYLGDYDKALELYNYAATLDPTDSRVLALRGYCYLKMKKYSEAADDVIKALGIDMDDDAWDTAQDFEGEGLDVFVTKLKIQQAKDKNNSNWPYVLGVVMEHAKKYRKAIEAYRQAYGIEAADVYLYRMSVCYSNLGDFAAATESIDRAIAMDTTNVNYVFQKSNYQYGEGHTQDAISTLDKVIEMVPDDETGYSSRGFYKHIVGDNDGAIEDFNTALVISPDLTAVRLERGRCYLAKNDTTKAYADFRQVIAEDTVYSDESVAQYAYVGLGMKDKAIEFQDSVLAHTHTGSDYYNAACIYSLLKDGDKAMSYLKQAVDSGYVTLSHINNDADLNYIRDRADFKTLVENLRKQIADNEAELDSDSVTVTEGVKEVSEIPFTRTQGVYTVPCSINGLKLHFVFDTGASTVSISMVEATFMLKNNYLTKDDMVGSANFVDANGNVTEGAVINLRKVNFGGCELDNVQASVVRNQKAPLLLGQSVLSRLGTVEIDYTKNVIRIKPFSKKK